MSGVCCCLVSEPSPLLAGAFVQTNPLSDALNLAPVTHSPLKGSSVISFSATSPFRISIGGATGILYDGTCAQQALTAAIPPSGAPPPLTGPTGRVFANFLIAGNPARACSNWFNNGAEVRTWTESHGGLMSKLFLPKGLLMSWPSQKQHSRHTVLLAPTS
jgi:hypothetical protein